MTSFAPQQTANKLKTDDAVLILVKRILKETQISDSLIRMDDREVVVFEYYMQRSKEYVYPHLIADPWPWLVTYSI